MRKMLAVSGLAGLLTFLLTPIILQAGEGMWQPSKLKRQESEMRRLGLTLAVEALYNSEGTGLNNAIAVFGNGCSSELISKNGLLLTNHHCAYQTVQALSSQEKNYLEQGYWAMNTAQELPCPGLKVTFTLKTEEVTDYILRNLNDTMDEVLRHKKISERIDEIERAYARQEGLEAEVKPFYNGNQYWVMLKETYSDVRLVAFPPDGIGKFGADTDNWIWPRMTGDFAMFRVYAGSNNEPAAYSSQNRPYRPDKYLKINTGGYAAGDFTMVYGFPYTSSQYISSYQLERIREIMNPIRIQTRRARLGVWDSAMRQDPVVFLKYAAKQSAVSNGYKKWQGELMGLEKNDVLGKKQDYERAFAYAAAGNVRSAGDRLILPALKAAVNGNKNTLIAAEYIRETVKAIELVQLAGSLQRLMDYYRKGADPQEVEQQMAKLKSRLETFYKNYEVNLDKRVFETLMPMYLEQGDAVVAPGLKKLLYNSGNDIYSWSDYVFQRSVVAEKAKMLSFFEQWNPQDTLVIKHDPAYQIFSEVEQFEATAIHPGMKRYNENIRRLDRLYMKRQMEYLNSGRAFYPDANQTLRLSYGQVKKIDLGTSDLYQTSLNQLIPRHDAKIEEFNIPEKLRQLYLDKDYGRWAVNGTVPVNFIATNHTSGGNSGSPVLNGKGELIGLNFDRIWQGTMSDLYFDPELCRNISVDIRYILFLVEKFGNAGWLLEEMTLVE